MLLTENNIKAELSYAYLHAVAARAGCEAVVTGRHSDSDGVDAMITAKERFAPDSLFTNFPIAVQLKATSCEAGHRRTEPLLVFAPTRSLRQVEGYGKTGGAYPDRAIPSAGPGTMARPFGRWFDRPPLRLTGSACGAVGEFQVKATQTVYLPAENPVLRRGLAVGVDARVAWAVD